MEVYDQEIEDVTELDDVAKDLSKILSLESESLHAVIEKERCYWNQSHSQLK